MTISFSGGASGGGGTSGGGGGDLTLIQNVSLAADAATIDLANIPQTYRDLQLVVRGRVTGTATTFSYIDMRFNGDAGAGRYIAQHHTSMVSGAGTETRNGGRSEVTAAWFGVAPNANAPVGMFGIAEVLIPDYTGGLAKSLQSRTFAPSGMANMGVHAQYGSTWLGTAAITSITLLTDGQPFVTGTRAALYGIAA